MCYKAPATRVSESRPVKDIGPTRTALPFAGHFLS